MGTIPASQLADPAAARSARKCHFLMCRPAHFEVVYAINPWMDTSVAVDRDLAEHQWQELRKVYERLGHQVSDIDPIPGMPDMVFAANGAFVLDGKVFGSRFKHAERAEEGPGYLSWFKAAGFSDLHMPAATCEGEGDLLWAGTAVLAGTGFRTDPAAHDELRDFLGRPVITLDLINPYFYHLDTALAVLDEQTVAYYPGAFSEASCLILQSLYPNAIAVDANEAAGLALNAVSDGVNVVVGANAGGFANRLTERGYNPVMVDLSELNKAGGGPKCCTLEIRR